MQSAGTPSASALGHGMEVRPVHGSSEWHEREAGLLVRLRNVAQFGSAPDLGSGGRRFKSCHSDGRVSRCKRTEDPIASGDSDRGWASPQMSDGHITCRFAALAQLAEHPALNRRVQGSIPWGGTPRAEYPCRKARGRFSGEADAACSPGQHGVRNAEHADEAQRQGVCLPCRRSRVRFPPSALEVR